MFRKERLTIEVAGQKQKTTCCARGLFDLLVFIIQHLCTLVNMHNTKNVKEFLEDGSMTTNTAIDKKKPRDPAYYRNWRKQNPEKQKAIMDRFYAKKAAAYTNDLKKIKAELKE